MQSIISYSRKLRLAHRNPLTAPPRSITVVICSGMIGSRKTTFSREYDTACMLSGWSELATCSPAPAPSRQPGLHVRHCVGMHSVCVSTPDASLTRSSCTRPAVSAPESRVSSSTYARDTTPSTSSARVMRSSKTHAQTPRDAFHRQPVDGSLASAARGQTSSSPDCSSTAPTTPSRSLTGTFL